MVWERWESHVGGWRAVRLTTHSGEEQAEEEESDGAGHEHRCGEVCDDAPKEEERREQRAEEASILKKDGGEDAGGGMRLPVLCGRECERDEQR